MSSLLITLTSFMVVLTRLETNGSFLQLCELLNKYNTPNKISDQWKCLRYNGYGCYCGLGGKGKPVDAVDECCMYHDKCYSSVKRNFKWNCSPYVAYYKFKDGKCVDRTNGCAWMTCECDRRLAKCVQGKKLNPLYKAFKFHSQC